MYKYRPVVLIALLALAFVGVAAVQAASNRTGSNHMNMQNDGTGMMSGCDMTGDGAMPDSCPMKNGDDSHANCPMMGESLDEGHSAGMSGMMNHDNMPVSDDGEYLYSCPMHPEETSTNPDDNCSICGMNMVEAEGQSDGSSDDSGQGNQ